LLKIALVNLNYLVDVHMNFAPSRIPALACSPQSEYGAMRRVAREGNGAMLPPLIKFAG